METNYELKHKHKLLPLKAMLLVVAMVFLGFSVFAQQGKSVKVANDEQLIEAMENPSIISIELEPGYYAYINTYAEPGTKVVKQAQSNGGRESNGCTYTIISRSYCFSPQPDSIFVYGIADANTNNDGCPITNPNCCPPDDSGEWQIVAFPTGATITLLDPIEQYNMNFKVDKPGAYTLAYEWDPSVDPTLPEYAYVETQYFFYGEDTVELSAPDVCGLSTLVSFVRTNVFFDPGTDVEWTLNGEPYMGPESTEDFTLTVPWCGLWELSVTLTPTRCSPITETIWIDFSCQPTADAGEDAYVCYDDCYILMGTTGLFYTYSTNYSYQFVQLNGPATLLGLPAVGNQGGYFETEVCLDLEDDCPYGIYEIQFQVQNGECEDEDEMFLTFYEMPSAYAGEDLSLCDELCFTLEADPFDYCGVEGVNYFPHRWWTLVQVPENFEGCTVEFDPLDPNPNVCITGDCECAYGEFIFQWNEANVKVTDTGDTLWSEMQCVAFDLVSVIVYEQPDAFAGDDYWTCVDAANTPYTYMMEATMEYCYTMEGVWTKSCGPGDVVFDDVNDPNTVISFQQPGRYIFIWTLSNEECEDSDTVLFDMLEEPTAEVTSDILLAECDTLCVDLADAGVVKHIYFGTDEGECPNFWDMSHWGYVDGPIAGFNDPATVTFSPDASAVDADMCVSYYGGYTVFWAEVNKPDDKDYYCADTVEVYVEFFETPDPWAGDDTTICGNCYTLQGVPYEYLPFPNQHLNDYYYWEILASNPCQATISDFEAAQPEVCIPDDPFGLCYGTYGFVLHQMNGEYCEGTDTVYIDFQKVPDPVCLAYENETNCWDPYGGNAERGFDYGGCICPDEVIEVCADGCTYFWIDPYWCEFGYDPFDYQYLELFSQWTFEWSVTGPAGMTYNTQPGYYDFMNGYWVYPLLEVCWGECCDTARVYLTITTPECTATYEYKVYVHHKPCIDLVGPDVSEVGLVTTYCSECPEYDNDCLLYTWTAEHCGEIISGQGTECIEVLWTDYNVNDGWGRITLTVLDTCTGCCNYEEMMVKIWPTGTLGEGTLSGYVYYHNNIMTPLNGVEIQLWNGEIPVMSTTSFNDIEGAMGMGYFMFEGVSETTSFGVTAAYGAPWYGANATDALAVELKTIDALPGSFVFDDVVEEAMDANNSGSITATDALWIKQRAISMVNYFPAGDWVFAPDMETMATEGYTIWALNAGDANRSNIPASMKATPAIALVKDGVMNVNAEQVFEYPIRVADANVFGAVTLNLGYDPAMIEVVDVLPMNGMVTNTGNGNVSIAWSSVNPMILAENDVVAILKVKAIGEVAASNDLFRVEIGSEFADATAKVIEPVTLKTYGITTSPAAEDFFLSTNRPNPFNTSTFIEYTLPETGKVRLSVLDMLGQEIAVIVESTQTAGSYSVEFSATGLATGVYVYKITVDGETRDYISTQRMVISH
jgi:hypothetical protein